ATGSSPASATGTTTRRTPRNGPDRPSAPHSFSRQDDVAGDLEMLVHGFARDEQVHDLRRTLEDQVDPEVTHDALDGDRRLAARAQRIGRLVAAAAPDLHRVVDDAPAGLGVVQLGDRGLEA